MRNQIVVLAGGKGTRMGDSELPKVLIMLKNKPLIIHLLDEIEKINQLVKPVIVVGYMAKQVQDVLGDGYIYAYQEKQLGTGDAAKVALSKVTGENILVLYGDQPYIKSSSLKKLMKLHHDTGANISLFTTVVPSFEGYNSSLWNFGRIIREDGKIKGIVELKDSTEEQKQVREVNPGMYMFNTQWLKKNINKITNNNAQKEFYLTDIVKLAVDNGESLNFLEIDPIEVIGINTKEELNIAENIK